MAEYHFRLISEDEQEWARELESLGLCRTATDDGAGLRAIVTDEHADAMADRGFRPEHLLLFAGRNRKERRIEAGLRRRARRLLRLATKTVDERGQTWETRS